MKPLTLNPSWMLQRRPLRKTLTNVGWQWLTFSLRCWLQGRPALPGGLTGYFWWPSGKWKTLRTLNSENKSKLLQMNLVEPSHPWLWLLKRWQETSRIQVFFVNVLDTFVENLLQLFLTNISSPHEQVCKRASWTLATGSWLLLGKSEKPSSLRSLNFHLHLQTLISCM